MIEINMNYLLQDTSATEKQSGINSGRTDYKSKQLLENSLHEAPYVIEEELDAKLIKRSIKKSSSKKLISPAK